MEDKEILNQIKRLNALADMGLVYAENGFDKERYEELKFISQNLMAHVGKVQINDLAPLLMPPKDYPTPKVDVRGFVLNEKKEVLMAREQVDQKWTIPGGWADIGSTPSEIAVKEVFEETGMQCKAVRLLGVWDKQVHPHPPEPYYIYKLMFHCELVGGTLTPGFDMMEADFFPLDALPPLSEERILKSQIEQLYHMVEHDVQDVYFD